MEIKNDLFGVRFERRGVNDKHVLVQLITEDDETWFTMGTPFSSVWLDDLIHVLKKAKQALREDKSFKRDKDKLGFHFSPKGEMKLSKKRKLLR